MNTSVGFDINKINPDGELFCRYCDSAIRPQELSFTTTYWLTGSSIESFEHPGTIVEVANQPKFACHRSCKRDGFRKEAFACQSIDAACNDCGFYERQSRPLRPDPLPKDRRITDEEQVAYLKGLVGLSDSIGFCRRYNAILKTNPQTFEGMPCFVHRRDMGGIL